MRLIDADELKKKIRRCDDSATRAIFDYVDEDDIDDMPTADVLDKIRAEVEKVFCISVVTNELRTPMEVKTEILQIIDKYREEQTDAT
jgi:hypothetical protein